MELEQRLRQALQLNEPGPAPLEAVMVRLSASPGPAPRGKRRGTVRTVIIGSVVLAAAAAMLVIKPGAGPAPQVVDAPLRAPSELSATAPEPERIAPAVPLAPERSAPTAQPDMANAASLRDLPLFPMPERYVSVTTEELGWQKAVERHPELVDGPDTDDTFYVALAMQRNGNVIKSAARLASRPDLEVVASEMRRLMPRNLASALDSPFRPKHTRMADGRMLRADAFIFIGIVADDYDASSEDATRASARVEQLVRDRYAYLFLPTSGTEVNRLTLFLTEAGAVEREKVELIRRAEPQTVPAPLPPPAEMLRIAADAEQQLESLVAANAQRMADQLGVPTSRIGLMGNLRVEEGMKGLTEDPGGVLRPFDETVQLLVSFAWPRREGEAGPTMTGLRSPTRFAESLRRELEKNENRLAPAVIIVERVMPDAFDLRNSEAGMPVVALTASGETLGAIRLNTRGNELLSWRAMGIELQKVDARFGSQMGVSKMETLTNEAGRTADVMFVWLDPDTPPAAGVN